MLLETEHRPVTTAGIMQTAKATIKATPKIFSFFADQTYANKPLAIARELAANAIDAHTAAGKSDVPIEVWLPTDLDPTFRVRDHGIGMAHDFVMGPFMAYTDGSTKDNANDQIGGFGIGSKSPFAYTDQFTLRVVHDGTVSLYSMFMDEDSIPSVGLLGQRATDENNGVEVSFPVKTEDFGVFANAANEALKYFNPLPIVRNGDIDAPDYIARGKTWAISRTAGPLGVIMGGVRYPVHANNLSYELRYDDRLSPLLGYGLDIQVPIGTCGVALSRESLSYNERTNNGLRAALEDVLDDVVNSFQTMFDAEPTIWHAKKALMVEVPSDMSYGARGKLLLNNAYYRGQKLTPTIKITGTDWTIDSFRNRSRRSSRKCPSAKWDTSVDHEIRFDNYEVIIIDDLPQSPKSKTIQRIKTYVDEECKRTKSILVLRDTKFDIDIPDSEFMFTSNLPEPEKVARVKSDRPRVRMFRHNESVGQTWTPGRRSQAYGVEEIEYALQPRSGILVVAENFETNRTDLQRLYSGLVSYNEVHFVNKADAEKLKTDKWPRLETVFNERLEQFLKNNPDTAKCLALRADTNLNGYWQWIANLNSEDLKVSKRNTPIGKIIQLHERYIRPLTPRQLKVSPFVKLELPNNINTAKLASAFQNQQAKAFHFLYTYDNAVEKDSIFFNILEDLI